MRYLEAEDRAETFVPHAYEEQSVDLGEVRMNYAVAGDPGLPVLLLVPAQTESWWGYERVLPLLAEHFHCHAVDLRGQGRSTWTPGRYTLDTFGNDLVRFIDLVIKRPVIVSGNSSGGVIAAWLAAFAKPGQIRAAVLEDAPLFASEAITSCGLPIGQGMGPVLELWHKWLGAQWSVGDWTGAQRALAVELPGWMPENLARMTPPADGVPQFPAEPPQNLREYDPEWAGSFVSGLATAACDHATMLGHVKAPILFTHHFHAYDRDTGVAMGAVSDAQVRRARELVQAAGRQFTYRSFPGMAHAMHTQEPELFAKTVVEWAAGLA